MSKCINIVPDEKSTASILEALLPMPKGKENILMLDGSEKLKKSTRNELKQRLQRRVRTMGLPYRLIFFAGHAVVCSWVVDETISEKRREWFDKNAIDGHFPKVVHKKGALEKGGRL